MNLIEKVKGVFRKMLSTKTVEAALKLQPTISNKMKTSIELWEKMYMNEAPWLGDPKIKSLGLPALIASEKARTATIEMEIKVTGESERAKFIEKNLNKLTDKIRINLEYGIALGGFIIKPYVVLGVDNKYKLEYEFVKATDFYPLSFSANGEITEAAFIDRIITKDYIYSKLEYHKLEGTSLIVANTAYVQSNNNGQVNTGIDTELGLQVDLKSIPDWAYLEPVVELQCVDTMLFAYFKMPQANTVDLNSPLGISGFAKAVGLIKNADEQYSNLLWEFEGGQLAVDVDRTTLNPIIDANGKPREVLPELQDRLFRRNLDLGSDEMYNVFSPTLRDTNIINGLNNILMHIEDACDLARGTLSQVTYAEARTATELKILKQRSFSANADIQKELQNTLEQTVSIIEKYCDLYEIADGTDAEVSYKWDDSIIVDKDAERQIDIIDVNNGLMSKVEYRMKWMGETELQAKEALSKISDEKVEAIKVQQVGFAETTSETTSDITTSKQDSIDETTRSNESNEVSKNNE